MSISNTSWTICVSCGQAIHLISDNDEYYKCRQCVYHNVCKNCLHLPVNNEGNHQLIKSSLSTNNEQQATCSNSGSSSIFTDKNYLVTCIGYCQHCLNIMYINKDIIFKCDQCPDFLVCQKCSSLMTTQHPRQHVFIKYIHNDIIGHHFGIKCDGCYEEYISGTRYKCEQCPPSYDLCSKCFQKSKEKHNKSHTFQLIQDPIIRYWNRKLLAMRVVELFRRENVTSNAQRDPLTGWTKQDAEKIIQQEDEGLQNYKEAFEKQQQRVQDLQRTHKEMQDARNRTRDEFLQKRIELSQSIHFPGKTTCPRCYHNF